jgi:hypothetical protein
MVYPSLITLPIDGIVWVIQGFVKQTTNIATLKPTKCTCFSNYLFLQNTLHVSEGLSVYHQEFKTARTVTGSRQQYLFDICVLLYVQFCTPDDGRKDRPKHVECFARINNLRNRCIFWFYYRNILRCTDLWTSDHKYSYFNKSQILCHKLKCLSFNNGLKDKNLLEKSKL